ncbi:hypothetical protein URH17368_0907 [Alicyclobacillus hesperidum URH17-3-68]|uniref:Permease n=1 Tax=Alicyclobacillus hesperidum TaxID=89784 RepID=A0A1H2T2Z1_9BACL|nr:hypothetical protein [Alicyclobacillus hesperidum]EJY56382.1 hypothetical protein URH17368_0907 [Alicyclobacillus hesperidum URH17-3-68]GLV13732.1 hypothetical protein Heshes_14160 [Alicyclobacillus hesperidum]SDW38157.1 hypothetical protein SAMN04489725_10548 [Alicyclobacillus hesperidum]
MDKTLIGLTAVTIAGYAICAWTRPELASEGWHEAMEMLVQAAPWILVSMFAAGLIAQLFDPAAIALWLGPKSGVIGITLAAFLGLVGTGSRFAVYPLAAGLLAADAAPGAVFAFVTSWQLISLSRLPAELPFFGIRYTALKTAVSLLMAIAGGIAFQGLWGHWQRFR